MAVVIQGTKLTGAVIRRSKKKVYFRGDGAGGIVASAWPKPRNKRRPNSDLQQAWVDHFKRGISMAKEAGTCTREIAEALANAPFSPNYFWRDAIMTAYNGKMINYEGDGSGTNARKGQYGPTGVFRVTTPTFDLEYTTTQNVPTGAGADAIFNNVIWDNNVFFNPATPNRVTIKAKGLYLFGATVAFSTGAAGFRRVVIQNSTQGVFGALARENVLLNQTCELCPSGLLYCEAGDTVRIQLQVGGGTTVAQTRRFYGVGIVPEMVTPP